MVSLTEEDLEEDLQRTTLSNQAKQRRAVQQRQRKELSKAKGNDRHELIIAHQAELNCLDEEHRTLLEKLGVTKNEVSEARDADSLARERAAQLIEQRIKTRNRKKQQRGLLEAQLEQQSTKNDFQRIQETKRLTDLLSKQKLSVYGVISDGHCLFRALEHQLSLNEQLPSHSWAELRRLAAEHLLNNAESFYVFFDANRAESGGDDGESFRDYCERVRSTAVWGSELELAALSEVLGARIEVYRADVTGPVIYGEFPEGPVLRLSYHIHLFGSGAHYNSVIASL